MHCVSTKGGLLLNEGYGFAVLCNCGDEDMDDIMWACYNAVMGLPLDTCHRWFIPAGREFADPEMLLGRYIGHEGVPAIVDVRSVEGQLRAVVNKRDLKLVYCGGLRFLGMDPVCAVVLSSLLVMVMLGVYAAEVGSSVLNNQDMRGSGLESRISCCCEKTQIMR